MRSLTTLAAMELLAFGVLLVERENVAPFRLALHAQEKPAAQEKVSDHDISNAYIYLLGRLLVLNQQQKDFKEGRAN